MRGASALGLNALLSRTSWRRTRLLILCYHGVSRADEHECSGLYVSPEHLRARFERLRALGATVLSLEEGVRRLREGSLPSLSVALTFDDGFADFHDRAYPLLEEFRYPATVYVATYYCKLNMPVFNPLVSYLLWKARGQTIEMGDLAGSEALAAVPVETAARDALQHRIVARADDLGLSAAQKDEWARTLAERCGVDYEWIQSKGLYHLMTPAELAELDPALVDVQLHTHRHRPPLGRKLLSDEISDNREALSAYLGRSDGFRHFCFPSGIYAREMQPWLEESGVESATTCDPDLAAPNSHPLFLPRFIDTPDISEPAFDGWVSGFCAWLPQKPGNERDRSGALPSD